MVLRVVVHEAEEGGFWAEVPALPGCVTQAETLVDLRIRAREAIEGYLGVQLCISKRVDHVDSCWENLAA